MTKKILVTGGAGFIGSNFVRYFLGKHPELSVINLDKLTYCGNLENLAGLGNHPRYEFIQGDICDEQTVMPLMEQADGVIHFAAESHVDNSIRDPLIFTKTNVLGTHVLLEAANKCKIKKFLHISTDEVYGSIPQGSFTETDPQNPSSPYSASKAAAELIARAFHHTFGLPLLMVRLSNTFGPRQYPEKLIPLFVTNLLEDKKVPLMGKGKNVRSWIYVADACGAIDFVFEHGVLGEVYNIPGTEELHNINVTKMLLSLLGKDESYIEEIPHRLGHDFRYSVDGTKLAALGWKPSYDTKTAFEETVRWYSENRSWWKKLKK
ncbi:MAG: dTDP-glucose 4,6-dehydratase [bacterium]|nr:dTDP-glucose 4,6-dehydratase [bacterium]